MQSSLARWSLAGHDSASTTHVTTLRAESQPPSSRIALYLATAEKVEAQLLSTVAHRQRVRLFVFARVPPKAKRRRCCGQSQQPPHKGIRQSKPPSFHGVLTTPLSFLPCSSFAFPAPPPFHSAALRTAGPRRGRFPGGQSSLSLHRAVHATAKGMGDTGGLKAGEWVWSRLGREGAGECIS